MRDTLCIGPDCNEEAMELREVILIVVVPLRGKMKYVYMATQRLLNNAMHPVDPIIIRTGNGRNDWTAEIV